MKSLSWPESEKNFVGVDIDSDNENIRRDAIIMIESLLKYYNPESFLEDKNFFNLSRAWLKQCNKCCEYLQAKLEHIVESKFRRSFSGKMTIMREKIEAINDLIDEKTDEQTIKESAWAVIDQLTEILWNLREELREKL